MKPKILLIYTGGTIGMVKDYATHTLKPFDFNSILEQIPELLLVPAEVEYHELPVPKDSSDIGPKDWKELASIIYDNYEAYDGFVVLHGTDTMAYTASALSFMLSGLRKPIVFTGSQLPVGDLRTDAKENLISAVHYAALQKNNQPFIQEVCLYFEYKLYRANRTTKVNAEQFDAFRSPNYPLLANSGIHMNIQEEYLYQTEESDFTVNYEFSDKVGLVKIFPGMNEAFLLNCFNLPLEAIVIEAYGSGNIFSDEKFNLLLKESNERGMYVIIISQCVAGNVELGRYTSSMSFVNAQAISGRDLTTEAAVTKAMYLLGNKSLYPDFREAFATNIKGECTV